MSLLPVTYFLLTYWPRLSCLVELAHLTSKAKPSEDDKFQDLGNPVTKTEVSKPTNQEIVHFRPFPFILQLVTYCIFDFWYIFSFFFVFCKVGLSRTPFCVWCSLERWFSWKGRGFSGLWGPASSAISYSSGWKIYYQGRWTEGVEGVMDGGSDRERVEDGMRRKTSLLNAFAVGKW
jgi:hypothetical protein